MILLLFLFSLFFVSLNGYIPRIERNAKVIGNLKNLRYWVDKEGFQSHNPPFSNESIKIVSYNVLGPIHGEGEKHSYAPVSVTKWTRRRDKILDELRSISSDIFCLQEISTKGLKETFIPGLKHVGMECCAYSPGICDAA